MNTPHLSPENVSSLIEHILKTKDPETVGLRRILRRQDQKAGQFPLHSPLLEEFGTPGGRKTLSEDEEEVLKLEKRVRDLERSLKQQNDNARAAVQNAFVKGHQDGLQSGIEQGKAEVAKEFEKKIDEVQKRVASFLGAIEESKRNVFVNAEHVLTRLSCEVAKKIISTELTGRDDIILHVIKKALTYIGDREKLILRVATDDLEIVSGRKDFWAPVSERLKDIAIEPDEQIEKGGCIIESNSGVVDARLGVQFIELTDIIEKVWENVKSSPRTAKDADEFS